MTADAVLAFKLQAAGTHALLWYLICLVSLLAISATVVIVLQRRLLLRPQETTEKSRSLLLRQLLLRYGLGIAVIAAAVASFAAISGRIAKDAVIGSVDLAFSESLRLHSSSHAYRIFSWVTHFGDTATLTGLCIAVAALLIWQRRLVLATGWVAAIVGNSVLNPMLKEIYHRARPLHEYALTYSGWSFPSGHASGSVVAYGMLAYVLTRCLPRIWHLPVILLAAAIAFSTGFSRIYLQAHYLSDVVAGFASGTAWLTVCISSLEFLRYYAGRSNSEAR